MEKKLKLKVAICLIKTPEVADVSNANKPSSTMQNGVDRLVQILSMAIARGLAE
jgi:hypothetical protein